MKDNTNDDLNLDIKDLFNVTFDSTVSQGDEVTDKHTIIKRKIILDQQERYKILQRENHKKVKAYHLPTSYTITQWIRDVREQIHRDANKEEDALQRNLEAAEGTVKN